MIFVKIAAKQTSLVKKSSMIKPQAENWHQKISLKSFDDVIQRQYGSVRIILEGNT